MLTTRSVTGADSSVVKLEVPTHWRLDSILRFIAPKVHPGCYFSVTFTGIAITHGRAANVAAKLNTSWKVPAAVTRPYRAQDGTKAWAVVGMRPAAEAKRLNAACECEQYGLCAACAGGY